MRPLQIAACVASLWLVAAAPDAPADAGCSIKIGPHFRVVCHFDDAVGATAALETVEAIWPLASELYGLSDAPLESPLNVHLYRRAADYLAAEREIAGGSFDKNLAFSDFDTRSSYVAVQPDLTDEALAAVGITAQTRHLLAHEAAHLVRYVASPTFRSHPAWFSDGAAIWIEEQTLAARGWSAGGDEDPYVADDMTRAQKLLEGGALPSATAILREDTKRLDMYDRYAVRKLLFHRLITRKDAAAFRAAITKALKLPDGPDLPKRFFETMTEPYATEGLEGLDLDYEQFVRMRTPAWDETYRALSTAGDAWVQTAFPENNAMAWRTAPVGADTYDVRGQIEILPGTGGARQMNLLLGRGPDGFVSVAFKAGFGVYVMFYDAKLGRWSELAAAPVKAVQLWQRLPFRVTVDGGKLTVRVDGTEVASVEVKEHAMSGAWGLGVQANAVGVWRGLRVETAKRAGR